MVQLSQRHVIYWSSAWVACGFVESIQWLAVDQLFVPVLLQVFDYLRSLPPDHTLAQLCDVFTYTAMVSLCVDQQELSRAFELVGEMKQRGVERNVHTYT